MQLFYKKNITEAYRLRFFFSKVFYKSEACAIKNMIQTCMYKQVDKTKQNVLLVIELILDNVKFGHFFAEIKKLYIFAKVSEICFYQLNDR
jgi:hypothetical protein